MSLGDITVLAAVAFALAFLTESLVEYFGGTLFDKIPPLTPYRWVLMYISAAVGVALTLYWRIDLIAVIANGVAQLAQCDLVWSVSTVGQLLSGLIVGRGANYLHDFLTKYLQKPQIPAQP